MKRTEVMNLTGIELAPASPSDRMGGWLQKPSSQQPLQEITT